MRSDKWKGLDLLLDAQSSAEGIQHSPECELMKGLENVLCAPLEVLLVRLTLLPIARLELREFSRSLAKCEDSQYFISTAMINWLCASARDPSE